MKTCSRCKGTKELCEFNKHAGRSDGHTEVCKVCQKVISAAYYIVNSGTIKGASARRYLSDPKRASAYNTARRASHPEIRREADAKYRIENRDKVRLRETTWAAENPERVKAYKLNWQNAHPEVGAATAARYRARKLHATPAWANNFFISEIYDLAQLRTKSTGFEWHVDHIVPLQGRNVCGLHVENNLQVIPGVDNLRKGNKHEGVHTCPI